MSNSSFDITIIGAGLNGLACAAACAPLVERGMKIAIIAPKASPHKDIRTTALTPHSQKLLEQWGVWKYLAPHALPITSIALSDSNLADPVRIPTIHFTHEECPQQAYFYMVENADLLAALQQRVAQLDIEHIEAQVKYYTLEHECAVLKLVDGAEIQTRLMIAADGANSPMRELANIPLTRTDYHQSALTCIISHEKPHHAKAVQHFFETGPLAFLPLMSNRTSIVWSLPPEKAEVFCRNPDPLIQDLNRIQGGAYGRIELASPAVHYPLVGHVCKQFHAERLALIGDAAHRLHPLAGQGLNMGLEDVEVLLNVIARRSEATTWQSHQNGFYKDDIAAVVTFPRNDDLQSYTHTRQPAVARLNTGQTILNHMMSNPSPSHRAIRQLGESIFNRLPPLKKFMMRVAAG